MPVTILTAKNARDNFCNARDKNGKFLPVTKKNARDKIQKLCPWQKKIARDILGTNIFSRAFGAALFSIEILLELFFCPWQFLKMPVTFLQKSSVARDTCPWHFWKKLPVTFHACPWHWSKKVPVTCPNARDNSQKVEMSRAKKFHGKKNTEPKERVASIILCFLLKSGGNKGRMNKEQQITSKD